MVGARPVGNDPDTNVEIWAPHVLWDTEHVEVTSGALKTGEEDLGIKVWKERGKTDGGWFWELPKPPCYVADQ
jgi:hypothetical protein